MFARCSTSMDMISVFPACTAVRSPVRSMQFRRSATSGISGMRRSSSTQEMWCPSIAAPSASAQRAALFESSTPCSAESSFLSTAACPCPEAICKAEVPGPKPAEVVFHGSADSFKSSSTVSSNPSSLAIISSVAPFVFGSGESGPTILLSFSSSVTPGARNWSRKLRRRVRKPSCRRSMTSQTSLATSEILFCTSSWKKRITWVSNILLTWSSKPSPDCCPPFPSSSLNDVWKSDAAVRSCLGFFSRSLKCRIRTRQTGQLSFSRSHVWMWCLQ
mmetsp:Transcript_137914/g.326770  ORF Transcript_137914/g.326770 Transcript_137914/m.326770 type:complete len:275 (+) Transcript_137914:868-1692(+)